LFAIEDKSPGRLLRFEPDTQTLTVLRAGLDEGEGVSVCPDGRLFYTEKAKGWVKQWHLKEMTGSLPRD
jgi:sugar lactone lactonase YvrE